MKSSSKSPRSSPLLQFFTSKSDKPNNNNTANNTSSAPITPSPSNNIETQSQSSSVSIIRTLSKCFDGGVGNKGDDAILNDDELQIVNKAKSINVNNVSKKENKNGTCRLFVCANLCVPLGGVVHKSEGAIGWRSRGCNSLFLRRDYVERLRRSLYSFHYILDKGVGI